MKFYVGLFYFVHAIGVSCSNQDGGMRHENRHNLVDMAYKTVLGQTLTDRY